MLHQLIEKIQFNAIAKFKKEFRSKPFNVLIVMDNKQKVFPMKFRKEKFEYFSKKRISFLRFMIVSHYPGNEIIYHGGFQYKFFDLIIKGYTRQDNVQVELILHHVIEHIKAKHRLVLILCSYKVITHHVSLLRNNPLTSITKINSLWQHYPL